MTEKKKKRNLKLVWMYFTCISKSG